VSLPWFAIFMGVGLMNILVGTVILGRVRPRTAKLLFGVVAYDMLMPAALFGGALMVEAIVRLMQP
jgi:hypothetical protein